MKEYIIRMLEYADDVQLDLIFRFIRALVMDGKPLPLLEGEDTDGPLTAKGQDLDR